MDQVREFRILLVEDEATDVLILREALADQTAVKYSLVHAERLEEAADKLGREHFDIVLLDLGLPDSQGIETLDALLKFAKGIPVLVLTGLNDESMGTLAMQRGAQDYLVKGQIDPALLGRAIRYGIERQRNATKLLEAESRFRALIENSSDAIEVVDADASVIYRSPAAIRMEGHEPASLFRIEDERVVHPDDIPRVREKFQKLLAHPGHPFPILERRMHKDGHWVWLEGTAVNLLKDPSVGGIVVNYRDVTERKVAEERISEQAALLDKASDAIIVHNTEGIVHFWNESAQRIYGYTAEEAIGRDILDLLGEDPEIHRSVMESLRDSGEWIGELSHECKDGEVIIIQCSSTLVSHSREDLQSVFRIHSDVTKQKKLQAELVQARRMESLGTLAGGIAHDFNNILSAIIGYSELVKMESSDRPEVVAKLDTVLSGAQRATNLVKQILAFSHEQPQALEAIQPQEIVSEALGLLKTRIPPNVELTTEFDEDTTAIYADNSQMHQLVFNLVLNALHSIGTNQGRIKVSLENFTVDHLFASLNPGLSLGDYVRFGVSDTGHGMDEKTMARIFDPFYTTKDPDEGTGLGLSVVHGIMKSYKGGITVTSRKGEGSTFWLYFPVVVGLAVQVPLPEVNFSSQEKPQFRNIAKNETDAKTETGGRLVRVLYVEDEAPVMMMVKMALQKFGCQVEAHSDPRKALEAIQGHPQNYDIVITDQRMPGLSGVELAAEAKKIRQDLPIILTTGYSEEVTSENLRSLGFERMLLKPHSISALWSEISEVLELNYSI